MNESKAYNVFRAFDQETFECSTVGLTPPNRCNPTEFPMVDAHIPDRLQTSASFPDLQSEKQIWHITDTDAVWSVFPWKPLPCQHSFEMRYTEHLRGEKKKTLAPPRCINMKREAASAPRSKAGGDTILLLSWTEPSASLIYRWLPFSAGTKINKNSFKKRSHVRVVFKNPPFPSQIKKTLLTNRKRQSKMQLKKGMESNIDYTRCNMLQRRGGKKPEQPLTHSGNCLRFNPPLQRRNERSLHVRM